MNRRLLPLLLIGALAMAAPAAAQTSLEQRVRQLEDKEEIARVLTDYGRLLDGRDFKAYAALFAEPDGEWDGGFGVAKGPAAIQAMMEKQIGTGRNGGMPPKSYHLLSNFEIDVDGDKAKAWSRWSFVVQNGDGPGQIVVAGRYDDALVRQNGHWRFQRRVVSADVTPPRAPGS